MQPPVEDRLTLAFGSRTLNLAERPRVMGILNVTPDSFSDGGAFVRLDAALQQAERLIAEGADIIDVGGESTRPGAAEVAVDEECRRVLPLIAALRNHSDIPVSIDTRKAEVARRALDAGADMVNDVSAFTHDADMAEVVAEYAVPVVLMHMRGTPETMQNDPRYDDVVEDVLAFFRQRLALCAERGVTRVVLDPGIGFGKLLEHNLALLRNVDRLAALGYPVLVGTSRKSFLGQITGLPASERLGGTIASSVLAALGGAHILRVHDVAQVRSALEVALSIQRSNR